MQNKYKKNLLIIGFILIILILIIMTYYLWQIENKNASDDDTSCVKIIYSDEQTIDLVNPDNLKDSDGKNSQARSISITNKCENIKTIQVYLNVLNTSTLPSNKIKAYINGDLSLEPTILSNLKTIEEDNTDILEKKLLYKYDIEPDKSLRLNIRLWKDEYATASLDKNTFHSTYSVIATNQIIKPTFKEKILQDNSLLSNINYDEETITTGLFNLNNTYYFRGNPVNNYFKLDDFIFRIVSINNDNSIKLAALNNTFDTIYNDYANKEEMAVFNTSTAASKLETWYQDTLSKYNTYFTNGTYCSDTSYTKYYSQITYGGATRLFTDFTPNLTCLAGDREYGGAYTNKVGILTADEMAIMGLSSKYANLTSYLNTGNDVCTSTPYSYYYNASIIVLNKLGLLGYLKANGNCTVIPIVNINGHLAIKGNGTQEEPYELDLED